MTGLPLITIQDLAISMRGIGFRCKCCSECCRGMADGSNLVLVGPDEIRRIMDATGLKWEEIAEPYPEFIETAAGNRITLAWCLRRNGDSCTFLDGDRCTVYPVRPWICRTYPFMLTCEGLQTGECQGLGAKISRKEAIQIARTLFERKDAEDREAHLVQEQFLQARLAPGVEAVIDSEGVTILDG
jgi:Fe-S-cluster containining protein